jgi:hypothetical protein
MAKAEFQVHKVVCKWTLFTLTASLGYLGRYKYGLSAVALRFLMLVCRPALRLITLLFALVRRSGVMTIVAVKA